MVDTIEHAAVLLGLPLKRSDGLPKFTGHSLRVTGDDDRLVRAVELGLCVELFAGVTAEQFSSWAESRLEDLEGLVRCVSEEVPRCTQGGAEVDRVWSELREMPSAVTDEVAVCMRSEKGLSQRTLALGGLTVDGGLVEAALARRVPRLSDD
eukprot:2539800-Amphidinium_carterae.1